MEQWSQSDYLLAVALAGGDPHQRAADKAGVSRTTVTRRMADPSFRELVASLRRATVDEAVGLLAAALADAVTQLRLISTDGDSEGNRLKASVAVLEMGQRYLATADLAERVLRLEEGHAVGGQPTGSGQAAGVDPAG